MDLTGKRLIEFQKIVESAEAEDRSAPLDEATWLTLRNHPDRVTGQIVEGATAFVVGTGLTLVVRPDHRRHGLGNHLLEGVLATYDGPLTAWSHGDHPGAAALARRHGFERVRELWVMRRATAGPTALELPELVVPDGVTVRGYRPEDAAEVVRVNAAAFAHHPEQGAMDLDALAERMAEPWFDPAGLLVASSADPAEHGRLLGFHWTKQHSPSSGEVYVVGIDPAAQGRGLGKVLTLAGLHHLVGLGVAEVLLYVESDNDPAVRLYSGLGFAHAAPDTHVWYSRGS